jgi:hypothetical protein
MIDPACVFDQTTREVGEVYRESEEQKRENNCFGNDKMGYSHAMGLLKEA